MAAVLRAPRLARRLRAGRGLRIRYAVAATVGTLFVAAGCGGPTGRSLPPASSSEVAATRAQLAGTEQPLERLHAMALALTATTPSSTCASDATALVAATAHTPATSSVSDTVLDQLLADEDAALAKVLSACESGRRDQPLLTSLDNVRSEVSSRLSADGVRTS